MLQTENNRNVVPARRQGRFDSNRSGSGQRTRNLTSMSLRDRELGNQDNPVNAGGPETFGSEKLRFRRFRFVASPPPVCRNSIGADWPGRLRRQFGMSFQRRHSRSRHRRTALSKVVTSGKAMSAFRVGKTMPIGRTSHQIGNQNEQRRRGWQDDSRGNSSTPPTPHAVPRRTSSMANAHRATGALEPGPETSERDRRRSPVPHPNSNRRGRCDTENQNFRQKKPSAPDARRALGIPK
jgi:hypothetical protein